MSSTAPNAADQDLDNLIFNEKKDAAPAAAAAASKTDENGRPQGDDHDSDSDDKKQATGRASLANVLPVDKIKNGASTATKYVVMHAHEHALHCGACAANG